MKTQDARIKLEHEIAAANRKMVDLENEIRHEGERIDALEKLLRYCACPKCGAELQDVTGSTRNAEESMEAAEAVGRKDVPCAFCDTEEQKEAFLNSLEQVGR